LNDGKGQVAEMLRLRPVGNRLGRVDVHEGS
jgi:hypothetical protein